MAKTPTIKKQDVDLIRLLRDTERRRSIDPLEEAEAFNRLLATGYVVTQKALEPSANRLSRRRSSRQRISVARFGPEECAHYFTHAGYAST